MWKIYLSANLLLLIRTFVWFSSFVCAVNFDELWKWNQVSIDSISKIKRRTREIIHKTARHIRNEQNKIKKKKEKGKKREKNKLATDVNVGQTNVAFIFEWKLQCSMHYMHTHTHSHTHATHMSCLVYCCRVFFFAFFCLFHFGTKWPHSFALALSASCVWLCLWKI